MVQSGFRNKSVLALLAFACFVLSGCLSGGGSLTNLPNDEVALVQLKIRLARIDSRVNTDPTVLSKGEDIKIQNLVVTFTSNLRDTIRDTVAAQNFGGFSSGELLEQSVLVNVSLRALLWWNIDIESHDQNDSVVHKGTAGPFASRGGQTMDLAIPLLNSRYLMYEARYSLPSQIYTASLADSAQKVLQKIYFYRLLLEIDQDTVHDSSSFDPSVVAGGRFISADPAKLKGAVGKLFFKPFGGTGADTITHVLSYPYVTVGTHTFRMSAFGYLEGDSVGQAPRLLYQGSGTTTVVQGGTPVTQNVKLDWKGPGTSDTTLASRPENWNGIAMSVTFGRVKSAGLTLSIDPTVPFKRAAGKF